MEQTPDRIARDEFMKQKAAALRAAWVAEAAAERLERILPRDRAVALNRLWRERRRLARR